MRKKFLRLLSIVILLILSNSDAQAGPSPSLTRLVEEKKEQVVTFFSYLEIDGKGMKQVREALRKGDYVLAAHQLLLYYKEKHHDYTFDFPEVFVYTDEDIRKVLKDSVTIQSNEGKLARTKEGRIDWQDKGRLQDKEWAYFVNRHYFLDLLLLGYQKTGDERYVKKINQDLKDWLLSNPKPAQKMETAPWRPTEAAIRLSTWPKIFYELQNNENFEDDTRLLMLMSIFDHAEYIKNYHDKHHNHATIEMTGLCIISAYWQEFKKSEEWYQHAMLQQLNELDYQILPDGAQNELSAGYHLSVLRLFQTFVVAATEGGRDIPPIYEEEIEKMYEYLVYTATPFATSPMYGDTDLKYIEKTVRNAAIFYDRPDWLYLITNGKEGKKPTGYASRVFPYAGKVISRSGYDKNMLWSIFDAGPWGTSHQHNDKLHLSVAAFGRPLLVDAGRFWYKPDIKRQYFIGSYSHNVILVDGKQQNNDVEYYETDDQFHYHKSDRQTYAQATFDKGFLGMKDTVTHMRGVGFLDNSFWIVIDKIKTNHTHTVSPLWHFHPDCHVVKAGDNIYSNDPGKGNLLIKPVGHMKWKVELVKGQEKRKVEEEFNPFKVHYIENFPLQGWYSETYNKLEPAYAAIYNANLRQDEVFAWILFPFQGENPPPVMATMIKKGDHILLKISIHNKKYEVNIDLLNGTCQVEKD